MFTTAHSIKIDTDEGRFVLIVETDEDEMVIDFHHLALELANSEGMRWLTGYAAEAEDARRTYRPRLEESDLDAYDLRDPKRVEIRRAIDEGR